MPRTTWTDRTSSKLAAETRKKQSGVLVPTIIKDHSMCTMLLSIVVTVTSTTGSSTVYRLVFILAILLNADC